MSARLRPARCPGCQNVIAARAPSQVDAEPRSRWAPFCSARCKDADLGRWLRGDYSVASTPCDDGDGDAAAASDDDN